MIKLYLISLVILVRSLSQYGGVSHITLNSPTDNRGENKTNISLYTVFRLKYIMSYLQSVTTHIWFICNWTRFLSSELSVFSHLVLQAEMQGD